MCPALLWRLVTGGTSGVELSWASSIGDVIWVETTTHPKKASRGVFSGKSKKIADVLE
jgi:NAD-dependent oxidoreductase involved in siderophore biosynthesis